MLTLALYYLPMAFLKSFPLLALLFVFSCGSNNSQSADTATQVTDTITSPAPAATAAPVAQLPSFSVLDATGKTVDLQDFRGKKVFVNLWATWCPPCRAEMPSIEKLYASVNKDKVAFVLLSLDEDFATAKSYAQNQLFKTPIYYPNSNMPELFNVRGIPATFIFNEKGDLVKQQEGAENYDTDAYRQLLQ